VKFVATKKGMTTNFFHLSFVSVFGFRDPRSGIRYPGWVNQDPESVIKIPDPQQWLLGSNDSRIRIPTVSKNRSILTKKIVSKLPDPDLDVLFIPDPGSMVRIMDPGAPLLTLAQQSPSEILNVYVFIGIMCSYQQYLNIYRSPC
jgi:hypothetical protein